MPRPRPEGDTIRPEYVKPFVDEGLGNSSYLVVSEPEKVAAVIDPERDADRYIDAAKALGAEIVLVLDTHLHADFLSGARELASVTGATIAASRRAELGFKHQPVDEGDELRVGDLRIRVLFTPGHSPEHVSYLLSPPDGRGPSSLFSGGALIVGGAARTDLLGAAQAEPLARQLYDTMQKKMLSLPNTVEVFPTHGAGSFCIAGSTSRRTTTIGIERLTNPLARAKTEEEFVHRALTGLPSYPSYFREMRAINQKGPPILGGRHPLRPLDPIEVREATARGVEILDVRPFAEFAPAHIAGSYGIDLDLGLAPWAGWLIPFGTPLALVAPTSEIRERAVRELLRIGYDELLGYLRDGLETAEAAGLPIVGFPAITVQELSDRLRSREPPVVLDVRSDSEWASGHIPGATHVEAGQVPLNALPFSSDQPVVAHCAVGARSAAAASILARRGYRNCMLLQGGVREWASAGFRVERERRFSEIGTSAVP